MIGVEVKLFRYYLKQSSFLSLGDNVAVKEAIFSVGDVSYDTYYQYHVDIPIDFRKMVMKRRCEYLVGRICSRTALQEMNSPHIQVAQGKNRCPVWPQGYIGSISHNQDIAIACVANSSDYRFIGIDIETIIDAQVANEVSPLLLHAFDKKYKSDYPFNQFVTILFSAKEALFKAVYPDVGYIFEFHDAALVYMDEKMVKLELQRNLSDSWNKGVVVDVMYKKSDAMIYSAVIGK